MARENQKQRTREALIDAAAAIAREGRSFSVAEVAAAAMVSTATAYRYFPNPPSLWAELGTRQGNAYDYLGVVKDAGDDPADRVDLLIRTISGAQFGDEAAWRALLRASLERWFEQSDDPERMPVRGTNRMEMTRWALEPLDGSLPPESLRRLTMALMLVFGADAMVVTRDTCELEPAEATEVMCWAAQALIRAAGSGVDQVVRP